MTNKIGAFNSSTPVRAVKKRINGRILGIDVFAILFTLLGFSLGLAALAAVSAHKESLWVQIVSYIAVGVILVELLVFCVREQLGYKVVIGIWILQLGTVIALLVFLIISVVKEDDRAKKLSTTDTVLNLAFLIVSVIVAFIIGVLYRLAYKYDVYG